MRRVFAPCLVTLAIAALAGSATAALAESWHSEQPLPPQSSEQSTIGVPVPLGHIGDIEFWAPNRGLLITAGNEAIHAGLYYYDGVTWRQLSTVCGGSEGRIAWAGPDDFWTISNQQVGQQLGGSPSGAEMEGEDRSLCHFQNGQVVASYAEPIGVPGSYQPMDAAACSGPEDCWFGGARLPAGVNGGAFHLHWNGSTLTALPSLEDPEPQIEDPDREVVDIASYKGRFYESVQPHENDHVVRSESASEPYLLHRIVEGSTNPFVPMIPEGPPGEPFTYAPPGVLPWLLSAFHFSVSPEALWALAGPPAGAPTASATLLLLSSGQFQQVALDDPDGVLREEVAAVAAEPGAKQAWASLGPSGQGSAALRALVAPVRSDGTVGAPVELPGADEELGNKGSAGVIACPAKGDCWLASSQGWLFHLGGAHPEDDDPSFQSLISYRPPDASIPFVAPETFPEDDSGANPPSLPPLSSTTPAETTKKVRAPLFTHVKAKLVGRTTLALTFTLATKSSVRLLAVRRKRTVAQTKRYTLGHGRHTLKLRLNPHAWPTKLDLRVNALGRVPLVAAGSQEDEAVGGPTAVSTSVRRSGAGV